MNELRRIGSVTSRIEVRVRKIVFWRTKLFYRVKHVGINRELPNLLRASIVNAVDGDCMQIFVFNVDDCHHLQIFPALCCLTKNSILLINWDEVLEAAMNFAFYCFGLRFKFEWIHLTWCCPHDLLALGLNADNLRNESNVNFSSESLALLEFHLRAKRMQTQQTLQFLSSCSRIGACRIFFFLISS